MKQQKTIQFTPVDDFHQALAMSNNIRSQAGGYGIYEGYENNIAMEVSVLAKLKDPAVPYMVCPAGDVYVVVVGDSGERILNKLELHACLDCALFGIATIEDNHILLPLTYTLDKSWSSRRIYAKAGWLLSTI